MVKEVEQERQRLSFAVIGMKYLLSLYDPYANVQILVWVDY